MERLEACYFCGTAADAPLREVSISPRARRGDPDATVQVTLCPLCETKLERVLSRLFDHVEARRATDDDPRGATDAPPAHEGDRPPSAGVDRIDVSTDDGGTEAPDRVGRRRLFTDPPTVDRSGESGDGEPPDDGFDDADDAEIIDDEPRVRARATTGAEPLDGVSVSEYNRVVRLLQNRSFPMDRVAFVDLAASAYDLGEDAVEAVLDALIDRGALAERAGELERPAEGEP